MGGLVERARRAVSGGDETRSSFLTQGNAERLARRLARLRGAAMKLGQLLSLQGEDMLPPEFADALAILRADADAMPASQLRRVLGRNLGRGWQERFRHFDLDPIAAASIGQVHAGTTTDGREVALKIQYPGVAKSIESDVDNLATALRLARLLPGDIDLSGVIAETKAQLRREADYRLEAESQARYRALVADEPRIVVPAVHADLSTRRVLAMDRLRGVPLEDLRGAEHPQARRDEVGTLLYRLLFRELFEFRYVQTDPNLANYLWLPESGQMGLLDFGACREVSEALSARYADLVRAVLSGDRATLRRAALAIDFLDPDERRDRVEAFLDLVELVCEPLRSPGPYDFGGSDLATRARDRGLDLAFRRGFVRPPPPQTIFVHRKLGGTFLLASRLRARVDVQALVRPFVAGSGGAPGRAPAVRVRGAS